MLTENNYNKGISTLEKIKYNIDYNRNILFNNVIANLAEKLLSAEIFKLDLTDEQLSALTSLINK